MYRDELIGQTVTIFDARKADWMEVGRNYTIIQVESSVEIVESQLFLLRFIETGSKWWECNLNCFEIDDLTQDKSDFSIGSKVIIRKDSVKFKKGDTTIIKEFIDGDKNKIVVEGVTPGGWLPKNKLVCLIKPEEYRFKNIYELVRDSGFTAFNKNIQGLGLFKTSYGKPLSNFDDVQHNINGIYINKIKINKELITKKAPWTGHARFRKNIGLYEDKSIVGFIQDYDEEYEICLIRLLNHFANFSTINDKSGQNCQPQLFYLSETEGEKIILPEVKEIGKKEKKVKGSIPF